MEKKPCLHTTSPFGTINCSHHWFGIDRQCRRYASLFICTPEYNTNLFVSFPCRASNAVLVSNSSKMLEQVYCPRRGLLCRWALNSMFVRRPSVCPSVRVTLLSGITGPFSRKTDQLFGQLNQFITAWRCFRFGSFLRYFLPKVTQNESTFTL